MEEKKIIDIAGPEDSKLNIGGKPMIIGHKSIASDPMVKSDSNEQPAVSESTEKDDAPQDVKVMSSSDKIKIEPPKSEEKPVDKTETKEEVVEAEPKTDDDSKASKDDKAPAEEKSDKSDDQASESTKVENEKSEDSKVTAEKETKSDDEKKEKSGEIDPVAAAMEKDQKIQELIKSKKYFVDIKKPARGSSGKKLITFIVLLVVLFMGLYLLIDSGKLDIGVKLPFSILGKNQDTTSQSQSAETAQITNNLDTTPKSESTNFEISDFNFLLPKNTDWKYVDTSSAESGTPLTLGFTITTSSGSVFSGYTVTGKGGDCQPDDLDIPHDKNNKCPTYQELARSENDTGYLIDVKYSAPSEGTWYLFCYRPKMTLDGTKTTDFGADGQPLMGFYLECGPDDIYIKINDIDSTTENYFDNATVKTIKDELLKIQFNKQ